MSLSDRAAPFAAAPLRFHRLTISDVRRETGDAVSIAFDVPEALAGHYAFTPGQYLTLRTEIDGEEVRRSYSICSGPDDQELRIAVKKVDGGAFSTWAATGLRAGDKVEVMTPTGRFGPGPATDLGRTHVAFAAGSGITPVMSILRAVLFREPDSRFLLFYGNRSTADILFREALEELKDRFLGRFSLFHVLSREKQDLPVLNGRLDADKVGLLLGAFVDPAAIDDIYVCGPLGMSDEVEGACRKLGILPERIHVERFVSELGGRPRSGKAVPPLAAAPEAVARVIFDGKSRDVPVADGEAVLDAALRAGVDLPYACKGGMCCTCRAKLVEGSAVMDVNYSLEPWEIAAGFVLTCQARATSARVTLDYDAV